MKFARYLDDTQIPEWKKAYIDFRGLKKIIAAIRKARASTSKVSLSKLLKSPSGINNDPPGYGSTGQSPSPARVRIQPTVTPPPLELPPPATTQSSQTMPLQPNESRATGRASNPVLAVHRSQTSFPVLEGPLQRNQDGRPPRSKSSLRRRKSLLVPPWRPTTQFETFSQLLESLGALERSFFDKLDLEVAKIEQFFVARELEARTRMSELKEQLHELRDHRKLFHSIHSSTPRTWLAVPHALREIVAHVSIIHAESSGRRSRAVSATSALHTQTNADPEDYAVAKRKLKRAVQEYYRGLELLNDYRVLNETGIRKALKKYDKYTKSTSRELYMHEKVESCEFARNQPLEEMLTEAELLYAGAFEAGDKKRATQRLRNNITRRTYYASVFRAGVYLGLGFPAFVAGLYSSFLAKTRERIPEWAPLLQVYAMLFIPTVFAVLVSLNVLAWARERINYVFIFELDLRTAIDCRQYAQLPSFFFLTLSYAFFFSYHGVATATVAPTTWPLLWMAFVATFMLSPLPIFEKGPRWWFLRNVGKFVRSGTSRVEFTDFWLGDQFCSMAYTLSNIWFVGCAATRGWPDSFTACGVGQSIHWPVPFILACLPNVVRLLQCFRRWSDEEKNSHLVNAGKYISSIVMYLCYYYWRNRGGNHDHFFVIWCIFATINSIYTSYWDLFMDWSVLSPTLPVGRFTRTRIYSQHKSLYYAASIVNVAIRFIWILYTPTRGPSMPLRQFITAALEALRRWQWNFFRLENEHVGNADQFRATREIPLPYTFHRAHEDSSDEESPQRRSGRRQRQSMRMSLVRDESADTRQDHPAGPR